MNTLETITKTRELLADPARWTKNCFAKDEDGLSVAFDSKRATCWCLAGGIAKVTGADTPFDDGLERVFEEIGLTVNNSVVQFNDFATHEQVVAALDETIARLQAASN